MATHVGPRASSEQSPKGEPRILVVDDHLMVAEALSCMLQTAREFHSIATASSGDEALRLCSEFEPQVILLDIQIPGWCAFDLARRMQRQLSDVRILFMTGSITDLQIHRALNANAGGIVLKGCSMDMLVDSVRRVVCGEVVFSPDVSSRIERNPATGRLQCRYSSPLAGLSERQLQVLKHLVSGLSVKEAAAQMFVSAKTLDSHKTRLMKQLDVHDRVELVKLAIREGLIAT